MSRSILISAFLAGGLLEAFLMSYQKDHYMLLKLLLLSAVLALLLPFILLLPKQGEVIWANLTDWHTIFLFWFSVDCYLVPLGFALFFFLLNHDVVLGRLSVETVMFNTTTFGIVAIEKVAWLVHQAPQHRTAFLLALFPGILIAAGVFSAVAFDFPLSDKAKACYFLWNIAILVVLGFLVAPAAGFVFSDAYPAPSFPEALTSGMAYFYLAAEASVLVVAAFIGTRGEDESAEHYQERMQRHINELKGRFDGVPYHKNTALGLAAALAALLIGARPFGASAFQYMTLFCIAAAPHLSGALQTWMPAPRTQALPQ